MRFDSTARRSKTQKRGKGKPAQVRVESGSDSELIGKGDSVSYRADVPHAIINTGPKEAVLFLVDIYS